MSIFIPLLTTIIIVLFTLISGYHRTRGIYAILCITMILAGCVRKGPDMNKIAAADLPDVPNFARVQPNLAVAGQPSQEALKAAKEAGYKTIVNLRPKDEWPFDEESWVKDLGMKYVLIPISSPETLTLEKGKELQKILNRKDAYPLMIHCGSSNRVGALLALYKFLENKASADEAIEFGKKAGLKSPALEKRIRTLITGK